MSRLQRDSGSGPTVPGRSGVRRVVHPVNAPEWGECTRCEIEFDDIDELDAHMAREHPRQCSKCDAMAAYRTAVGSRLRGASYCADHMDGVAGDGRYFSYVWVLEPANDPAPRLPEDHPLEESLRGLHGSREAAQEERFGDEVLQR